MAPYGEGISFDGGFFEKNHKIPPLPTISNSVYGEYGFTYTEFTLFKAMGIDFKERLMLYCFREVKCKHGFTKGI